MHEGGIKVERLDDGAWRFTRVNGPHIDVLESVARGHSGPLGDWRVLVAEHEAAGLRIDRTTAATRWRGETMDYGLAIDILVQREEAAGTFPRKRPEVAAPCIVDASSAAQ